MVTHTRVGMVHDARVTARLLASHHLRGYLSHSPDKMQPILRCIVPTRQLQTVLLQKRGKACTTYERHRTNGRNNTRASVWMNQSWCDLEGMRVFHAHLHRSSRLACLVCFLAQQSVEKALKAGVLTVAGVSDRNHSLVSKLAILHSKRPHLIPLLPLALARELEPYYLASRYPDRHSPQQAPADLFHPLVARKAATTAEKIVQIVAEKIVRQ